MADVEGMTHMPPRITLTADDVRELLRQWPEWDMAPNALDGWESWRWRGVEGGTWIPIVPDAPTKADYQALLWHAVRDAGVAMGIGTDIYVHLGMMLLQRRLLTPSLYLDGWLEDERRRGHPLPDPAWEPKE